ncbi:MAG TPA: hypothetical protein PLB38_02695 [bacterium]|nr:hypothetical protein [bacterium]
MFKNWWNNFNVSVRMLYLNRLIMLISTGLIGLFSIVFVYQNLNGINGVLYYSLLAYGLMIITTPLGAFLMTKVGQKNAMILSMPFLFIHYLFLIKMPADPWFYVHLSIGAVVLFKAFYWIPFNVEFSNNGTKNGHSGSSVAALNSLSYLVAIVTPGLAGFILTYFDYTSLFSLALIISGFAMLPLLAMPDQKEKFTWTIPETYGQLFKKANRKMIFAYLADGAEGMVAVLIWPIFLFQLLKGNYLDLGILSTLIVLGSIVLQQFLGKLVDSKYRQRLLPIGAALYSLGWLMKMFVVNALQVFLVGVYHNIALVLLRTPFDAFMYETHADQGHYVDEYTVLHEIALAIGRVLMIAFLYFLLQIASLNLAFLAAAVVVLAFTALNPKDLKANYESQRH